MEDKLIRRVDDLGRIVIPKTLRQQIDITEGDAMTVEVNEKGQVVLTKVKESESDDRKRSL